MPTKDPRVDDYIANSNEFARPILAYLRKLVHTACPEVEETIKWRFPTFIHKGMLCSMAAFTRHCTFGFWKHSLIIGGDPVNQSKADTAMGQLGRIATLAVLPTKKALLGYIRKAVRLNEQGKKCPDRLRLNAEKRSRYHPT